MKNMRMWVGVLAAVWLAGTAQAWRPAGWVYVDWPWAYESTSDDWHWFSADGTQWMYAYPPGNGWALMQQSGIAQGWSYWDGEFAYDSEDDAWCWRNTPDTQWVVNMRTGVWSRFGETGNLNVAITGNDITGTGSESNPFATNQKAINVAATGQIIAVGPGTYAQKIAITQKAVQLVSTMGPAKTTIQGSALDTVINIGSDASNTVIRGFCITGGTGKPYPSSYGNDYKGGGIHCGTFAMISDCIIHGNGKGTPRLDSGTFGGAIYSYGGNLKVVNCLMFDNFAWASGGATLTEAGIIEIDRCTVYGNYSTSFFGYQGGLGLANSGGMTVNSSIIWGNGGDEIGAFHPTYNHGTYATVSYCDVEGGPLACAIPTFTIGSGNLNLNPQFVDVGQTNFELLATSPCINAGDPAVSDPDGTRANIGYTFSRF